MFNFFEELFAPGRKHTSAEQRRLELSRVDLGIGDPDRGPIDLTSGKVTVRAPGPAADPAPDRASAPAGAPIPAGAPTPASAPIPAGAPIRSGAPAPGSAPEPRHGHMRPVAPEQDAVLDRPRPGKPVGGPERRADEEPEE
ncbi:DUF6191 domain-containing protein [Streptomyces sp. NPDC048142]|uniref:DUF6191 domain-containing protein n=1 Tax=Streptomyces sp. NPDC048142 TaxID=3365501 RepID=UPI00370FEA48